MGDASLGGCTLTFGEVDGAANGIGHALRAAGVAHGDRVAWWAGTTLDGVLDYGEGDVKGREAIVKVIAGMPGNRPQARLGLLSSR